MEDEHQSTLKKKIQILFQLGKWSDVIRLCDSYSEKFGKEADVDTIRLKCKRHMGIPAPAPEAEKAAPKKEESQQYLAPETAIISISEPAHGSEPRLVEDGDLSFAPPDQEDVAIGDPFADNELVIGDPFADDEPRLRLTPEEPPVVIPESAPAAADVGFSAPGLEMESPTLFGSESPAGGSGPDFLNVGTLTIDADPELISSGAPPKPSASVAREEAEEAADDLFRSTSGRVKESVEEKRVPTAPPVGKKTIMFNGTMYEPIPEDALIPKKEALTWKKNFNFKLVLLVVLPLLIATALWLALSGKLDLSGGEPRSVTEPVAERSAPRRPRLVKPATPPVTAQSADAAQAAEQEKGFAEKLKQAEDLNQKGDLANAWAALLEAKKIKVTEPLSRLEEELARKISDAAAPKSEWEKETEALAKAKETDTIAGWRDFLRAYPQSESVLQAQGRITILEKKALDEAEQQQLLRIQQTQKVKLRAAYLNLSQADVSAQARQDGRPPAQFEAYPHGGATVMLDFSAGLMWSLYDKPMAYDKAKWWANRVTAGYGGWRLPTAEEALSLLQIDRGLYVGLADFAVWTGDGVSNQSRSVWALQLPSGQFAAIGHDQMAYVWAVRQAVK